MRQVRPLVRLSRHAVTGHPAIPVHARHAGTHDRVRDRTSLRLFRRAGGRRTGVSVRLFERRLFQPAHPRPLSMPRDPFGWSELDAFAALFAFEDALDRIETSREAD